MVASQVSRDGTSDHGKLVVGFLTPLTIVGRHFHLLPLSNTAGAEFQMRRKNDFSPPARLVCKSGVIQDTGADILSPSLPAVYENNLPYKSIPHANRWGEQ